MLVLPSSALASPARVGDFVAGGVIYVFERGYRWLSTISAAARWLTVFDVGVHERETIALSSRVALFQCHGMSVANSMVPTRHGSTVRFRLTA